MFSLRGSLARCSTSFWLGQAANVSPPSFPAPHGSSTNLKGQKHTGFPLLQQTAERNQQFSIHKLSFILLGFTPFPNTPASFYYSRAGAWGTRVRAAQLSVLNLQHLIYFRFTKNRHIQQSPNHNQLSGALAPWYLKPNDTKYLQPVGAAANQHRLYHRGSGKHSCLSIPWPWLKSTTIQEVVWQWGGALIFPTSIFNYSQSIENTSTVKDSDIIIIQIIIIYI